MGTRLLFWSPDPTLPAGYCHVNGRVPAIAPGTHLPGWVPGNFSKFFSAYFSGNAYY